MNTCYKMNYQIKKENLLCLIINLSKEVLQGLELKILKL
ncbi:Uncharacterised protein [Raoultella planticola]|nr:Uncharacterised protein [Raoultella planticola]